MNQTVTLIMIFLLVSSAPFTVRAAAQSDIPATTTTPPYAVEQTIESFSKTVHGGVQHIVVKSAENTAQIKLVQNYLRRLAEQYGKGDFSSAIRQHGPQMPGLAQLQKAPLNDIRFRYKALDNGGQIHYSSEYPQYVQALHEWFDAQSSAHGKIEIPGHNQHHATNAE